MKVEIIELLRAHRIARFHTLYLAAIRCQGHNHGPQSIDIVRVAVMDEIERARFYGMIEPIGGGVYLGRCGVRLGYGAGVLHEEPETLRSYNPDAVRTWIKFTAAQRGYDTVVWQGDALRLLANSHG